MAIELFTGFNSEIANPEYDKLDYPMFSGVAKKLVVPCSVKLDLGKEFPEFDVYEKYGRCQCHIVVNGEEIRILRLFGFDIPEKAVEWNFDGINVVRNLKSNWEVLRKQWVQVNSGVS